MKLTFILVAISLMVLFAIVIAKEESTFERTFKLLHREPPAARAISNAVIQPLWIDQKLDHFDENEKRTWKMRYMANDEFFKAGAPVFIFVGGEWEISKGIIMNGHVYDMAKEHHGYLFYTEHRFYGQSKPTSDVSTENLKYLTVKQALADLAHFINTMKATVSGMAESKFILTGCSYSATMATWFKKLYPDLVVGCWASSAPLFAKVDFVEYKQVAGESIRKVGGVNCYNRIHNAIKTMEYLFATNRGTEVKSLLNICGPFDEKNQLDIWTLFSHISDIFAAVVQNHIDEDIKDVCNYLMQEDDDLNGLADFLQAVFGGRCVNLSYKAIITPAMNSAYTDSANRQWLYQTCHEYGWYQTSGSKNQPFGTKFPVTYDTTKCRDVFGKEFTNEFINKQAKETNDYFGGLEPNVTNVYFTHGELDPWRPAGIQDSRATIIPMHSHCNVFDSISDYDTPELRASKERIAQLVREWVRVDNLSPKNA